MKRILSMQWLDGPRLVAALRKGLCELRRSRRFQEVQTRLRPYQGWFFHLLASVVTLTGGALLLYSLLVLSMLSSKSQRHAIGFSAYSQTMVTAEQPAVTNQVETVSITPVYDWFGEEPLHKAAAALIRHQRVDKAIELLMKGEEGRELARTLAGRMLTELDLRMSDHFPVEWMMARSYWNTLSQAERQQCFAPYQASRLALMERLMHIPSSRVKKVDVRKAFPDSLLLCMLNNLHIRIRRENTLSRGLMALVLEDIIPAGSQAGQLYRHSLPLMPVTYDRHAELFNNRLAEVTLYPHLRELIRPVMERYRGSDAAPRNWLDRLYGPLPERLEKGSPDHPVLDDLEWSWSRIPAPMDFVLARELHRRAFPQNPVPISPGCMRINAWFKAMDQRPDLAAFLRIMRTSPEWQALLNRMEYDDIPGFLARETDFLLVASLFARLEKELIKPLGAEQRGWLRPDFDWMRLCRLLKVRTESLPAEVLRRRSDLTMDINDGLRAWVAVPAHETHAALVTMAQEEKLKRRRANLEQLASYFALNRALL